MSSGQLYKPYLSDSEYESNSDSEVESDGYISEESFCSLPGRNPPVETAMPAKVTGEDASIPLTGTKFETAESRNTFLITINSRDRDTKAYPLPTFFTIRLPRTLRNIKQINIQQLNLLNSFFNFSAAKGNTFMYVLEQGRTRLENGSNVPNDVKISIRNGTYTADDLVTELTSALNTTPLFSGITFNQFSAGFRNTGNFGLLFNTPGPIVFNSLTQSYDRNQTINNIISRYFQIVQTVGTVSYTDDQTLVAYYYPVMKEMIIASPVNVPFDTAGQEVPPGFTSWYDYIVFAFQGLDDPYVTNIVKVPTNIPIFDSYRNANTFASFLVNKYTCSYNSKQGRLVISAPSLNDSISTDLNTAYSNILGVLAIENGFANLADFNNQYSQIQNLSGSLIEFYNYIQKQFAVYFGVNFGKYADVFYQNPSNEILLNKTLNRYGWNTDANSFQLQIKSNLPPTQISTLWSNIVFPQTPLNTSFVSTLGVDSFNGGFLSFSNSGPETFGYTDVKFRVYPTSYDRITFKSRCRQNISLMTIPRYIDERGPGTDMIFNLGSNTTPFLFTSPGPGNYYILSDISGNLIFNMYTVTQVMFYSASFMRAYDAWIQYLTPQFINGGRIQETDPSFGLPPAINSITLTSFRPAIFFQVNADQYPAAPNAHFNITFYVETQDGSKFPVPLKITWYKDRAAFMTDALNDLGGSIGGENPRHYFKTQTFTDISSAQLTVDVNNLQVTYFHVNLTSTENLPTSIPLRIFCVLTDNYGVYSNATILNGYGLPWSNLPALADQFTPASAIFNMTTKSIFDSSITQLGYDISGVSNNLLDYTIQSGCNYYDPTSIQDYISPARNGLRYLFLLGSNGASQPSPNIAPPETWSLYFYNNSANTIRDLYNNTNNIYLAGGQIPKPLPSGKTNENLLVNWLQPATAIKETFFQPLVNGLPTTISTTSAILPCINASPLTTDSFSPNYIDSNGFSAVGFYLPTNSIVKLESIQFKFAYMSPVTNPANVLYSRNTTPLTTGPQGFNGNNYFTQTTNIQTSNSPQADWDDWYLYNRRNIKIGIYRSSDINGASFSNLSLSNALVTMTLNRVTQVGNFTNQVGSLRTREPDWGTYYSYVFDSNISSIVWDVANPDFTSFFSTTTFWRSTIVSGDRAPTYIAGENSTVNYFFTVPQINTYNYMPRSYGIAPSVGNSISNPIPGISSYTTDIGSGFAAVPFYYDNPSGTYKVGSFYGLSFTRTPMLPSTSLIGAAPYYGPPGPFGWYKFNTTSTFQLYNGDQPSYSPYYWNTKVRFESLDQQYNPATDLSSFGYFGGISTELQDTVLFLYSNSAPNSDFVDFSNATLVQNYWVWGKESASNYIAWDDQDGYNFFSYIYNAQVRSNTDGYASHIRAYDPIPEFNTGLRFIGKNYTDYGNPTLFEIALEIASLSSYVYINDAQANVWSQNPADSVSTFSTNTTVLNTSFITHDYAESLKLFDASFSPQTFGRKPGFNGVAFNNVGYSNTLFNYINFASTTRGSLLFFQGILSTATGQLNNYVLVRYSNILPSTIINRNRITDPLPFSFLFGSKTPEPYKSLPDEWGLGWNLGFKKIDTIPRTTITSDTFIRITQDYIYLKLNPEFNINTLAVSGKENLAESRDARSQDTRYFSKILLNNFGGFSRAAVQLPKLFNPVLGKYDMVSCQLVDQFGNQIDNADCDYDFVLEVTEIDTRPKDTASLVLPATVNQLEIVGAQGGKKPTPARVTQQPSRSIPPKLTGGAKTPQRR
jgi:hypothetical protein